jgi:uncharacterized protein (TIGR02265 family)
VAETLAAQASGRFESPSTVRPGLPREVDKVLSRALSFEPPERYGSAGLFARELAAALAMAPPEVVDGSDSVGELAMRPEIESTKPAEAKKREATPPQPAGKPVLGRIALKSVAVKQGARVPKPDTRRPRRPSTLVGFSEVPLEEEEVPLTRGALFRAAYRVLSTTKEEAVTISPPKNATLVRAGWVAKVATRSTELAKALGPQGGNLSWYPTSAFVTMLETMADDGHNAYAFSRALGRNAALATFSRFFGADPSALPPTKVLAAAEVFWGQYHSWGEIKVNQQTPNMVELAITGGPDNELICSSTTGLFEQIALLAGARNARVKQSACIASGDSECVFQIRWGLTVS